MVYPVFNNKFEIGESDSAMNTISDLETFEVSFDNNVEEWSPMDMEGWTRRLATGKSLSITLNGKRNTEDEGNNFVAGLAFKTGTDLNKKFKWTMIDGTIVKFNCVVNVTNMGGGDSTSVAPLEFEVLCDGKPTVTSADDT